MIRLMHFGIAEYCYLHCEQLCYSKLPTHELRMMKNFMNEREALVKELCALKGKAMRPDDHSSKAIKRYKNRMKELKRDVKNVEDEIDDLLVSNPGIVFVNATAIIVTTENFNKFTDARKYAYHISVYPFPHSSGTSVRGKTQTSFYVISIVYV